MRRPESVITLAYELRTKAGALIESSETCGPIRFVPGRGMLLPALESRIASLSPGDEAEGELEARRAFGDPERLPLMELKRTEFGADEELEVGRRFEAKSPSGDPVRFEIVEVDGDRVRVRVLHPLADEDIVYKLRVLEKSSLLPPPLPAAALGIDSAAIQLFPEDAPQEG